jgi:hypothetical protein
VSLPGSLVGTEGDGRQLVAEIRLVEGGSAGQLSQVHQDIGGCLKNDGEGARRRAAGSGVLDGRVDCLCGGEANWKVVTDDDVDTLPMWHGSSIAFRFQLGKQVGKQDVDRTPVHVTCAARLEGTRPAGHGARDAPWSMTLPPCGRWGCRTCSCVQLQTLLAPAAVVGSGVVVSGSPGNGLATFCPFDSFAVTTSCDVGLRAGKMVSTLLGVCHSGRRGPDPRRTPWVPASSQHHPGWPKSPEATGRWLKRSTGALRQVGIEAVQHPLRTNKGREWTLTLVPRAERDGATEPSLQPSRPDYPSERPLLVPGDGCDGCDGCDGLENERGRWTEQDTVATEEEICRPTVTPTQPSRMTPYAAAAPVTVPVTVDGRLPGATERTDVCDVCSDCGRPMTLDRDLIQTGTHARRATVKPELCRDCSLSALTPAGFGA